MNLVLFGLTAPFAAALMDRFGIRRVTASALVLVAIGSGATVWMTASWQLVLCWGVLIGLGTGSMALVFAASVAQRWFVRRRGLVVGVLTAGSATGQLIFLPVTAWLAETYGWRAATLVIPPPRWPSCRSCCCSCATTRRSGCPRVRRRGR